MSNHLNIIEISNKVFSISVEDYLPYQIKQVIPSCFTDLEDICVTFDRTTLFFKNDKSIEYVRQALDGLKEYLSKESIVFNSWELPICFDNSFTNDLEELFNGNKEDILTYRKNFLKQTFKLEFYGFLPGFGYLSGLPKNLHLPRKSSPSKAVQKGSVAIGGAQVGVYPQKSPGGWQCIGNCPIPWINLKISPYVFINPGDHIRFKEIDLLQYQKINLEVEMDVFSFEKLKL